MELAIPPLCSPYPWSQLYPWISPLPDSQRSLAHPAPRLVKYLHSLVIHSESSRHEAPMGLRETPLQNGVILRDLFAELSSGTGEPLTYRAEAYPLQVGKHPPSAKHPGCRRFNSISQGWVWLRIPQPLLYPAYTGILSYLAHQQQASHEHCKEFEL